MKNRWLGLIMLANAALVALAILAGRVMMIEPAAIMRMNFLALSQVVFGILACFVLMGTAFYHAQRSQFSMGLFRACFFATTLGSIEIWLAGRSLGLPLYVCIVALNGLIASEVAILATIAFDGSKRLLKKQFLTLGVIFSLIIFWGIASQSWLPLHQGAAVTSKVREAIILILIPIHLLLAAARLSKGQNFRESIWAVILKSSVRTIQRPPRVLAWICVGVILSFISSIWAENQAIEGGVPSFLWLTALITGLTTLSRLHMSREEEEWAGRIPSLSAKRFILRHKHEGQRWAESVGLRSAHFIIDHDPNSRLAQRLPASLGRIRSEEILRCVCESTATSALHHHMIGGQLYSAIDPEATLRPCIDTLKLFSCLYLDTAPLIERRIRQLTNLMPIIDQRVSKIFDLADINREITKGHWLFFLDYGWLDQNIIHAPNQTRYMVHQDTLPPPMSEALYHHIEKTNSLGSTIWLTPEARERLMQEGPLLSSIIEPCPIAAQDQSTEHLFFVIKFENLIPRLQKYYQLDSMRQHLISFEPSVESVRLISLVKARVTQTTIPGDFLPIINTLTSFPWRGYREKDAALGVLQQIYQRTQDHLRSTGLTDGAMGETEICRTVNQRIAEAIEEIGYPGQTLHAALQRKNALRNMENLLVVAQNPDHRRFAEAWLLLASMDLSRFTEEELRSLGEFIKRAGDTSDRLAKHPLVQTKAIDAIANLAKHLPAKDMPLVRETISRMARWFLARRASADMWCYLLDVQSYLENVLRCSLSFDSDTDAAINRYLERLRSESESPAALASLLNRWQRLQNRGRSMADRQHDLVG